MMFVAMNNFKVAEGREQDFETTWRERESYLQGVDGFIEFKLLKCDVPGEYISHSTWRDREAFVGWMTSEAFVKGHRQGSLAGVLEGPPQVKVYEALIVETPEGRTAIAG